jgi:hypothetical protein
MRTPLGDGWYLVTDDLLLYPPADPEGHTAAGRRAWRAHDRAMAAYFAKEPDFLTIHLEGPAGLSVTVPADGWEDALSELGIKRKRRRPPGPMPGTTRLPLRRLAAEVWRLHGAHHGPTQLQAAVALGVDVSTVRRALPDGTHWRPWVAAIGALKAWTIEHQDAKIGPPITAGPTADGGRGRRRRWPRDL